MLLGPPPDSPSSPAAAAAGGATTQAATTLLALLVMASATTGLSLAFRIDPQWSKHVAAAPSSWPKPDWSTVPTYAFCGPGGDTGPTMNGQQGSARLFNASELDFLAGKSVPPRRRPRWYAAGYATLDLYENVSAGVRANADSQAKQVMIARQVKAAAPDLPVWGGTAWDITLCGPSLPFEPFTTCMMEVDETCRASCGYDATTGDYSNTGPGCLLLTCNGTVITRADNHTIHGFQTQKGREAWAKVFSDWKASGVIDGVVWDGMDHGGGPGPTCSKDEAKAFSDGQNQTAFLTREAIGWDNVALCNDGTGIGNWSFLPPIDRNSKSNATLAGIYANPIPTCSGSMFERFRGGLGDVLSLYNAKTWDYPYVVAVRGLGAHNGGMDLFEGNDFPSVLSGFLVAGGAHHYFLTFWQYDCASSGQFLDPPHGEYLKPLGLPGPTHVISGFVNSSHPWFNSACKDSGTAHANCSEIIRMHSCDDPKYGSSTRQRCPLSCGVCSVVNPPQGPGSFTPTPDCNCIHRGQIAHEWAESCTCIFHREFASGTRAYYNGTTYKECSIPGDRTCWSHPNASNMRLAGSSARCVLWSDNTTTGTVAKMSGVTVDGCAEARQFFSQLKEGDHPAT